MGTCNGKELKEEKNFKLTLNEIEIIKTSWKPIVSSGLGKHGTNLMVRVFIEHKELKPLWGFARNLETHDQMNSNQMLKAHGEKLFSAIDMAVNSLDDMNNLVPILVQLGSGHCKWGVKEEHFEIIGKVLIETLQDALQEKFTPKVKRVWIKLFNIVSMHMKYGIRQQNDMETSKHLNKQTVDIHILNENDISINGNCLSLNNNGNFSKVFPNDGTHEMD